MISLQNTRILLTVLVVAFLAFALVAVSLSRKVKNRSLEDSDDPPVYAKREARPGRGKAGSSADAPAEPAGIPGEIIAAIAAAVSCLEPGAVVTSVRRAPRNGVSAWKMAGLLENTRPF